MDYRKFGETYYVRMDRGDEIISSILGICQKEQIESAIFVFYLNSDLGHNRLQMRPYRKIVC